MSDPFYSSKDNIRFAKNHISNFERQCDVFFDSHPYGVVVERNYDGSRELHTLKLLKELPVDLPGIASDATTNLRASLDKALNAVASLTSVKPTYFPFASNASEFESALKGRCKDLPDEISNLVRTFKPYKGGNDLLWAFNKLSGANKHDVIRPIGAVTRNIAVSIAKVSRGPSFGFNWPVWDRAKNEMVLGSIPVGYKVDFQFAFNIAICNIEFLDGKQAISVLNDCAGIVESIVMAIEAEAKRIGLF
jgi:hypothetical protein